MDLLYLESIDNRIRMGAMLGLAAIHCTLLGGGGPIRFLHRDQPPVGQIEPPIGSLRHQSSKRA